MSHGAIQKIKMAFFGTQCTTVFYSSPDFVWDNLGEQVPEDTFCHLLDFLVQNEDNTGRHTNNLDGLPPLSD